MYDTQSIEGEPSMPNFNENINDPVETQNDQPLESHSEGDNQPVENEGEGSQGESQPPVTPPSLIESWKEDRSLLEQSRQKVRELEDKLARTEHSKSDEDLENLSEEDRINRLVELRESQRLAKEEERRQEDLDNKRKEINFWKAADPYFKDNIDKVINLADEMNVNLENAIRISKLTDNSEKKGEANAQYNDNRKRQANGAGQRSGSGRTVSPYNPQTDGSKSIGDLYKEGGIV